MNAKAKIPVPLSGFFHIFIKGDIYSTFHAAAMTAG